MRVRIFLGVALLTHTATGVAQEVSGTERETRVSLLRAADVAREGGRFCEALSLVRRAEALGATAGTHLMSAEIRQRLGQRDEAVAAAEQCLVAVSRDTATTASNLDAIRTRCSNLLVALRAPAAVEPRVVCEEPREGSPGATQRVLGFVTGGVGVALVGVGVVAGALFQGASGDYDAQRCAYVAPNSACQDLYDGFSGLNTLQWVGYLGGGALIGAGVALVLTAPRAASTTALACGRGPGALGLSCGVRF